MAGRTSNIDIAQAGELQNAIQGKLEEHGYSDAGDPVMAEYVTVMLANSKTSDQITAELSELIGQEYQGSLTDWIFDVAIPEHYTKKAGAASQSQPTSPMSLDAGTTNSSAGPAASEQQGWQVNSIQTVQDSRDHERGQRGLRGNGRQGPGGRQRLPDRPHQQRGSGVFGTAVAGIKREGDSSVERPNRRARLSDQNGDGMNVDNDRSEQSIFDRAGVRAGGNQFGPGGRRGPNNRQGGPQFGSAGPQLPPSIMPGMVIPSQIPGLPPLHIPSNFYSLPPAQQQQVQQQIFQHQLITAAAANQLFQPVGQNGHQKPGHQQGRPHNAGHLPFPSQPDHQVMQQQQGQSGHKTSKPVRLPDRPSSEQLCKYGVECKNAICKYSHPSPAATKESGLVLTKDVCDQNLACEDKDCPKSHVSPAQKTDPEGRNVQAYLPKPAAAPQPVAAPSQPIAAPNPGAKPCMYGADCTRPGCFFSHPTTTISTPCRFGLACTRPDCHFQHPPGHRRGQAHSGGFQAPQKNKSATFNGAAPAAASAEGSADVKVEDSRMSARLKKFTENDSNAGERELIVDGQEMQEESK